MRLSSLVIATVLLFSVVLFAQHSSGGSGGGSSSSGGHSGGGLSGGGSSGGGFHGGSSGGGGSRGGGASSSSSSGRSNSGSGGSARGSSEGFSERSFSVRSFKDSTRTGLNVRPGLLKPPVNEKVEAKPEKKSLFAFLHRKKPAPARVSFINPRPRCKWGHNCVVQPVCPVNSGWYWLSYCGAQYDQYYWGNTCQALADQVAAERERMRTTADAGASLRYQMLMDQYHQCMRRYGTQPFSSYLFMSELEYP